MLKTFSVLNLMVIACTQQSPSISWLISLALVVIESVKRMISNALRHMVAENLRILNVKKADPFDLIYPDDVERVLGLDSDYNSWFAADSVYRLADLIDPYSGRRAKPTGKSKVKLYLVNDCGGEWEDAWNEPVIAFANQEDATRCAVVREHRQGLCNSGFGYRDYSGSFVTEIDAVIDDSILEPRNTRGHVPADGDRPWYQVPGHSLSGLPLSSGITNEGTDYE